MIIRELCDVSVKRLGGLQTGLLLSIDKKTYGLERTDAMWLKTAVRPSCFLCFVFPRTLIWTSRVAQLVKNLLPVQDT